VKLRVGRMNVVRSYVGSAGVCIYWLLCTVGEHFFGITAVTSGFLTLILLMWRTGWAPNSIPIYIQQDATLHNLFISGNCSTCFGWYFHPSSGAHTTVFTASGICHTVTAICRYRRRVGTGVSVLWVAFSPCFHLWPILYFLCFFTSLTILG